MTFQSGETNKAVLSGFTIQNGVASDWGGGIIITNSSPIVENNVVRWNEAVNYHGGGVFIHGVNSSPKIRNNTIIENKAQTSGGGIDLDDNSTATITKNIIKNIAF